MSLNPRLALVLAAACGLALALVILYLVPPEQNRFAPPCLFHKMTGLHCPGCGATRAVHALLHLRLAEALNKNALFLAALPFLGVWTLRCTTRWLRGESLPEPRLMKRPWVVMILAGAVFAFGILRNLPWPPFTLLAPH